MACALIRLRARCVHKNHSMDESFVAQVVLGQYLCRVENRHPVATAHPRSTAFLLAQVGAHAAARFAERVQELGLVPAQAGLLRLISMNSGASQRELASLLGMVPSRLVSLIDELEELRLVERRDNPEDRRLYALHLTDKGRKAMANLGRVAKAHDDTICAALDENEREQLSVLLRKIADDQKLTAGIHPGFARIGETAPGNPGSPGRR